MDRNNDTTTQDKDKHLTTEDWAVLRDRYLRHFVVLSSQVVKSPACGDPTLAAFHEPKKEGEDGRKPSTG